MEVKLLPLAVVEVSPAAWLQAWRQADSRMLSKRRERERTGKVFEARCLTYLLGTPGAGVIVLAVLK